jgi:RNA polymerase sigma-70 factor (ECF subfamily)
MLEVGTLMGDSVGCARSADEPIADGCLLRELIGGSEAAFAALYDRYSASIFATAQNKSRDRAVAADVVQETFLTLWNRAEQFDPSRGSLIAWLSTIARNRTVDHLRSAGHRLAPAPFSAFGGADAVEGSTTDWLERAGELVGGSMPEPEPEIVLTSRETRETIAAGLASLGSRERLVMLLAYQEGLTQSEIAARLGWPIGTVKTRMRRAHRQLRALLDRSSLLQESSQAESGLDDRLRNASASRSRSLAS